MSSKIRRLAPAKPDIISKLTDWWFFKKTIVVMLGVTVFFVVVLPVLSCVIWIVASVLGFAIFGS